MQDSIDRRRAGRHDHDQHGRSATSPLDIRWRGWTQILKRTWTEIQEDRVLLVAAGAAFYVFLSIVPALSALLSIYGLVFDPQSAREQAQVFLQWLPAEAQSLIGEQMARLTGEAPTRLGTALAVSLAISIWSASAATKAVIEGLNVVYDEQEKRSSIALYAVALAFTAGGLVLVVALVAVNIVLSS
ncbi:MAG: YihY/virulence factor BrkB family protein, partial [Hyphomicrobiaceae bacterium]